MLVFSLSKVVGSRICIVNSMVKVLIYEQINSWFEYDIQLIMESCELLSPLDHGMPEAVFEYEINNTSSSRKGKIKCLKKLKKQAKQLVSV